MYRSHGKGKETSGKGVCVELSAGVYGRLGAW